MNIENIIIFAIIVGFIYFTPTIIANSYNHYDIRAIFIINLLLGWTLLGWVISLIWALKKPKNEQ